MPQFDPFILLSSLFYIIIIFMVLLSRMWIYLLPLFSAVIKLRSKLMVPTKNTVSTKDTGFVLGQYPQGFTLKEKGI